MSDISIEEFFGSEFVEHIDVESRTISRFPGPYSSLAAVLREAFEQASNGKGRELYRAYQDRLKTLKPDFIASSGRRIG